MDDYLGFIELMDLFLNKGLITKEMVEYMFGYYIVESWENKEIQDYVRNVRENLHSEDYYSGLQKLAGEFKET